MADRPAFIELVKPGDSWPAMIKPMDTKVPISIKLIPDGSFNNFTLTYEKTAASVISTENKRNSCIGGKSNSIAFQPVQYVNHATIFYDCVTLFFSIRVNFIMYQSSFKTIYMKQDKIDQLSEQSYSISKTPSLQKNLTLPPHKLKINLQETEEQEVEITSQRRSQFRINENSRRRFY